jgi:hypothetical protein
MGGRHLADRHDGPCAGYELPPATATAVLGGNALVLLAAAARLVLRRDVT